MPTNNLGLTLEQSIKYQGRFGQWAWIFHRVSGLGVLLFLTIHISRWRVVNWGKKSTSATRNPFAA